MGELRVAVVGAGLGGLCLAQGLRRSGIEVTVHERDSALLARRQGYRLHLDARAGRALHQCLPPDLFEAFLATCSHPSSRFTVLSERLRLLHTVVNDRAADPFAPESLSTSVNRQTLREILATGLEEHICYRQELTSYQLAPHGVQLSFADGRRAQADILVGADGVNSPVRQQRLPHAEVIDTGGRCIYGRTPLSDIVRALLPAPLLDGFTAIIGGPVGMAAGLVCFRRRPDQVPGVRLSPADDYLMWAITARGKDFPLPETRLRGIDAASLHETATAMIRRWHPDLRQLVALADIDETFLVRIHTSVPVPAWHPGRVTLLGDAIHAMTPARGSGANTALQDAGTLCRALTAAVADGRDPITAIGDYEARMRDYGFAAVEASLQAERETATRRNSLAFWLYRHLARPSDGRSTSSPEPN